MNLYLIGFRGSGKSSVAPLLAQRLGWHWVDADRLIEQAAGRTIAEIFQADGQQAFRSLEHSLLARLAQQDQTVVALGGGVVEREENRELLNRTGRAVWLRASRETLQQRIAADSDSEASRPPLTAASTLDEIGEVLQRRRPLYESVADWVIDTDQLEPGQVAAEISGWLQSIEFPASN